MNQWEDQTHARAHAHARAHTKQHAAPANQSEPPASWWLFDGKSMSYDCESVERAIAEVEAIFEKEGPFDGVLGFSQGACLTLLLAARQQQGKLALGCHFEFVALFSGFLPHDEGLADQIRRAGPFELPSFHSW